MRSPIRSITIALLLAFCCITIIPLLFMIGQCYIDGYDESVIGKLISEI